jgi:ketosteroid isomerase-like protein
MRSHVTVLALAATLVVSCSDETVARPPSPPVNWSSLDAQPVTDAGPPGPTARERAASQRYVAALASPGFAQLTALLDDDVHIAFPGGDDLQGRAPTVHAHELLFGAFDDRVVVANRLWRTANAQVVEWTLRGVHAREWMEVAATHKSVTFKGLALLWTKDDGSLVDIHVYFDVAVVKAMLGIGPKSLLALPVPPLPVIGAPNAFDQTGSSAEKRNVALVSAELDALEGNREADYVAAVTDDAELSTPERAEPRRGKDAFKAYFAGMHKAISQLDTTTQNAWGVAQFAIVEYVISGEQVGPIEWVPAQRNNVVRLQTVDIAEIRDGAIAHVWRYDNPAQITVGASP